MKITSGILRNRQFKVPKQEVRPTKGQVREAVFSSLGGSCDGLKVLDLFAGSGGLGLEAWSRGAESVTFVEQNSTVWKNLKENIQILESHELGQTDCIKADVFRFLPRTGAAAFDLILADPPYDLSDALEKTLNGIREHSILTADGMLVYELRSSDAFEVSNGWKLVKDKVYGDTRILMLRLNEGD